MCGMFGRDSEASEERAGESGEAGRSAGAELPESLASGPGLPHGEGEVRGTSAGAGWRAFAP